MNRTSTSIEIRITETGKATVVQIVGESTVANIDELQLHLTRLSAQRPELLLFDLSGLTFISSLGLGAMLECQRGMLRKGVLVRFAALQPAVRDMLRKCRLDTVFRLYESVEAASHA